MYKIASILRRVFRRLRAQRIVLASLVLCLLLNAPTTTAQVTIWSEDFQSYPNGTIVGAGWDATNFGDCDGTGGTWGVFGGAFLISDYEGFNCCDLLGNPNPAEQFGDNGNTILIGPINIAGFQGVSISFDFMATANMECNSGCVPNPQPFCQGGHDQAIFSYSIDGAPPIVFGYWCGPNFCSGGNFACGLNIGSTLQIIITAGNQAASEQYTIDNILVQGFLNPPAQADASPSSMLCVGDNLQLDEIGGAAVGWAWDGPGGFTAGIQNPTVNPVSASDAGLYTVTITDALGCTATSSVMVDVDPLTTPSLSTYGPLCENDAMINLNLVEDGISGTWSGPGVNPGGDQFDPSVTGPGNFMITFTPNAGQCANTNQTTIIVNGQADAGFMYPTDVCSNNPINPVPIVVNTPGGTFSVDGGATIDPSTGELDLNGIVSGMLYTITYTVGACPGSSTQAILVNTAADADFTYPTMACPGDPNPLPISIDQPLSGVFTVNNGAFVDPLTGELVMASTFPGTTYSITYTIAGACPNSATQTIDILFVPDPAFTFPDFCDGDNGIPSSVTTPGGIWSFNPAPGDGAVIDPVSGQIFGAVSGSTYSVQYMIFGAFCDDSEIQSVQVFTAPNAGADNTLLVCNIGMMASADLDAALGIHDAGGSWNDDNGSGADLSDPTNVDFSSITGGPFDFTYTVPATANCMEASAIITVNLEDDAGVGSDGNLDFCEGNPNAVDLFDAIGLSMNTGGSWLETSGTPSGADISNPFSVDFSSSAADSYTFEYTLTLPNCGDVQSLVQVVITDALNAGADNTILVCKLDMVASADLEAALGSHDAGGTWGDDDATGVDLSDVSNVDFSGVNVGLYDFTYTIAATADCPEASATVTVILEDDADVGTDGGATFCEGSSGLIDLFDEIGLAANTGGSWLEVSVIPSGADISNPFAVDFSGASSGNYAFTYDLTLPNCGDVQSLVQINITDAPDAGSDGLLMACSSGTGAIVDLQTALGTHDPGGTWSDGGSGIDPNTNPTAVDLSGLAANVYNFMYTIPAMGSCAEASATVLVDVSDGPDAGSDGTLDLCTGDAQAVDLFAQLNDSPESGGDWNQVAGALIDISDPQNVDFSNASPEVFIFEYTLSSTPPCTATSSFVSVQIEDGPNAGTSAQATVCNTDLDAVVDLDMLIGAHDTNGQWTDTDGSGVDLSDSTLVNFNGVPIDNYTFTYTVPGNASCPNPVSAEVEVMVISSPNPGEDVNIRICEGDGASFDLFNALGGTPDNGGTWSDDSATGIDLSDPSSIDLSDLPERPFGYAFTYHIVFPGCDEQTATVTFVVGAPNLPGQDSVLAVCNEGGATVDLEAALGAHDTGTWEEVTASGVDLSDPTAVDFTSVSDGDYDFLHIVASTPFCPGDTALVTVELQSAANAGSDIPDAAACEGSTVDLSTLVNGQSGGMFVDIDGSGALNGSMFNTSGLNGNTFSFEYIVDGIASCPGDTAIVSVAVVDQVQAGSDRFISACQDGDADLIDLLFNHNGDAGGQLIDLTPTGALMGSFLNTTNLDSGTYDFLYVVGDGITCPSDTAEITVELLAIPTISLSGGGGICPGQCVDIDYTLTGQPTFLAAFHAVNPMDQFAEIITAVLTDDIGVLTICNTTGPTTLGIDTFFINNAETGEWKFTPAALSDDLCTVDLQNMSDSISVNIGDAFQMQINPTLCPGDSIIVNGTTYNTSNPQGMEVVTTGPCDSIFEVDLRFFQDATFLIDSTLCFGQSLMVGDSLFDESRAQGSVVFEDASMDGCDSTVIVSLEFSDVSPFDFAETLCPGESVTFNGVEYNETNPTGRDTLFMQGQSGCDSVIRVDLSFFPIDTNRLMPLLCPEEALIIDGVTIDPSHPSDTIVLEQQAANMCDSVVVVHASFHPPAEHLLNPTLCSGDSVVVNGVVYNESNPMGTELLMAASQNMCDSLVMIDLAFDEVVSGNVTDRLCNGEVLTVGSEMFDIDRPQGTVLLEMMSSSGCDSLVNVDLTFITVDAVIDQDELPCPGENTGSIRIESAMGGDADYRIVVNGNEVATTNSFPLIVDGLSVGDQTVSIFDANNCMYQEVVSLEAASEIVITALSEYTINRGMSTEIVVESNVVPASIEWMPGTALSCTDCLNPTANPQETTTYTISITDANGCIAMAQILVRVVESRRIFIPNVINANGNTFNDRFYLQSAPDVIASYNLWIFDRWGNRMFAVEGALLNDPDFGWDGRFKGDAVNPGVYVYYGEVLFEDGTIQPIRGDLTVIR